MDRPRLFVGYTQDEMSAIVSCQAITQGKALGVLRRAGRLYVLTGAVYNGLHGPAVFDACEVVPASQYRGKILSYDQRSAQLYQADAIEHPDGGTEGDRIRAEGRFYEGVRVRLKGAEYVLTAERECWRSTARPSTQGDLF